MVHTSQKPVFPSAELPAASGTIREIHMRVLFATMTVYHMVLACASLFPLILYELLPSDLLYQLMVVPGVDKHVQDILHRFV